MSAVLTRQVFEVSRLMEFFSEKELNMQIGTGREDWPMALLKEMIDNGLDACESSGIAPIIQIDLGDDFMTVIDNGPGLPDAIIEKSLDYSRRVSTNAAYVAPTRGQLGNALKCVYAAPFVADGERGMIEIDAHGLHHTIEVRLDHIRQEPAITHTMCESTVKNGTIVKLHWKDLARLFSNSEPRDFYRAHLQLSRFASFNPHADFFLNGELCGSRSGDSNKWVPSNPTSPHWYTAERLRDLIARHISQGDDFYVRDLVAQFRGLSGSAKRKQVVEQAGLSGLTLQSIVSDGKVDCKAVTRLLHAMQAHSAPVKPEQLGFVGEGHVREWMLDSILPVSFHYKRLTAEVLGLPYMVEAGFGVLLDGNRSTHVGINFTAMLANPFHDLDWVLSEYRVDAHDPCMIWLHVTSPRIEFTDRGKSHAWLPHGVPLRKAIEAVTKEWVKIKRKGDRDNRARQSDIESLKRQNNRKVSLKDAAYRGMESAYLKASDGGKLPANARQIMYAARGDILMLTGKDRMDDKYFTQTLLPDFMDENPELTAGWDVCYDDRGKLTEPHTGVQVPLGTINVRNYIQRWGKPLVANGTLELDMNIVETSGPDGCYRYALFIEKEGFAPLLDKAKIKERFDLAVFSSKGMSSTSARRLVEKLSGQGVTILVAHDFDKSGFDILSKLSEDTRRYRFKTKSKLVDIGLRLDDIQAMGLDQEPVTYESDKDPKEILKRQGATEEECAVLVSGGRSKDWRGHRVELNAMTSRQFLEWLEWKLGQHGMTKVVPDEAVLQAAYKRSRFIVKAEQVIRSIAEDECDIPDDLAEMVTSRIADTASSWPSIVRRLATQESEGGNP